MPPGSVSRSSLLAARAPKKNGGTASPLSCSTVHTPRFVKSTPPVARVQVAPAPTFLLSTWAEFETRCASKLGVCKGPNLRVRDPLSRTTCTQFKMPALPLSYHPRESLDRALRLRRTACVVSKSAQVHPDSWTRALPVQGWIGCSKGGPIPLPLDPNLALRTPRRRRACSSQPQLSSPSSIKACTVHPLLSSSTPSGTYLVLGDEREDHPASKTIGRDQLLWPPCAPPETQRMSREE